MSILIYKPQNFKLWELVDPWTYEKRGQRAWSLIDPGYAYMLAKLRVYFGPAVMNTYGSKRMIRLYGLRRYAGYRFPGCKVGAEFSMHRLGKGGDPIFIKWPSAEHVRKVILLNQEKFPKITRMERKVSWVHFDCAPTNSKRIILFNP